MNRNEKFLLLSAARELLPGERVANCLRVPAYGKRSVDIVENCETRRARYANLGVCGSVWHCPVCAPRIAAHRAIELITAFDREPMFWQSFHTFTIRHSRGEDLSDVLQRLQGAWRALASGRNWQRFKQRHSIRGSVAALEVTYGDNGFHPHYHVLFIHWSRSEATNEWIDHVGKRAHIVQMSHELREFWQASAASAGAKASREHGTQTRISDEAGVEYLTKSANWSAAQELTLGAVKRGRASSVTPFQLLQLFAHEQDAEAAGLFKHYAQAIKGKRQLRMSKGLRELLRIEPVADKIAAVQEFDSNVERVLAQLDFATWRVILHYEKRAELLEIVEQRGIEYALDWLDELLHVDKLRRQARGA